MSNRPLVSVVIPTYNYAHFIAETIESVLAQTYPNMEVIVVDDASTDDTVDVIERFGGSGIQYVRHSTNKGLAGARNTGIEHASGAFITFIDSDDMMLPQNVEAKAQMLVEHPEIEIAHGNVEIMDEDGMVLGVGNIHPQESWLPQALLLERLLFGNPFYASAAMLRLTAYDLPGTYREKLRHAEDWDMWLRMACFHSAGYQHEPLVRHRLHRRSLRRQNFLTNLDLEVLRDILSHLFDHHSDKLTKYDQRGVYWTNYFSLLHNKAGVLPGFEVVRLYARGLRQYPERRLRLKDVELLSKVLLYAVLPRAAQQRLHEWHLKRKYRVT